MGYTTWSNIQISMASYTKRNLLVPLPRQRPNNGWIIRPNSSSVRLIQDARWVAPVLTKPIDPERITIHHFRWYRRIQVKSKLWRLQRNPPIWWFFPTGTISPRTHICKLWWILDTTYCETMLLSHEKHKISIVLINSLQLFWQCPNKWRGVSLL